MLCRYFYTRVANTRCDVSIIKLLPLVCHLAILSCGIQNVSGTIKVRSKLWRKRMVNSLIQTGVPDINQTMEGLIQGRALRRELIKR